MSAINITRLLCDGCSHTVDARDEQWLRLEVKTPDEDGLNVRNLDLCKDCAGHLRRRCAEIGIKL